MLKTMPEPRIYVLGLPVVVTVADDGTVTYEVDSAETGTSLWEDEDHVEEYGDAQVEADFALVEADHARRVAGWNQ